MKKLFCFIMSFVSVVVFAQDLIVKNDGDEIKAKVLSVDDDKVSYRKWSNKNGPTYSLSTDKIFMIKYMNGDKDVFSVKGNDEKHSVSSKSVSENAVIGYVEKHPAANNAELISKYNPHVEFNLKPKKGKSYYIFPIMGVAPSSVFSNEDVEINFVRKVANSENKGYVLRYYIEVTNKTNRVLYIDKGNSFRSVNNISMSYYNTKQISVSTGGGSGVSVGLGSIAGAFGIGGGIGDIAGSMSVGSGTSSSVATTYACYSASQFSLYFGACMG